MSRILILVAVVLSLGACAVPEGQHPEGGWKADYEDHHGKI